MSIPASSLPARYQDQIAAQLNRETASRSQISNAVAECDASKPLVKATPRSNQSMERISIRFVGYRVRLLDPDSFAGSTKHLIDGLRHAGIIPDDSPQFITLQTEQVKVATFAEERTEIEIDLPD